MQICVFCASARVGQPFSQIAEELGRELGKRGHDLVFGGADVGLMGTLAHTVKERGRRVIGVIPERIRRTGIAFKEADELIITRNMAERQAQMIERADAFIALPGGLGTLQELTELITLKQLGYVRKPAVLLNAHGFYESLVAFFEQLYRLGFANPSCRMLYHIAQTPAQALDAVESWSG